ncbi:hypothetical protein FACS189454_04070 [Planctomycetales bacterium]|nr:hypothetical protein FACS189454_04070 [Planctomycetales bacterium]
MTKKMTKNLFLVLTSLTLAGVAGVAAAATPEYTSVEEVAKDAKLNRDFQIQGEYQYTDASNPATALNIVAEGNGQFRVVMFRGGLPGDSWKRGDGRQVASGSITENGKYLVVVPEDVWLQAFAIELGKIVASKNEILEKVSRKSPTLGQKAPVGAIVLFDDGKASDWFTKASVNEDAKTLWAEAETKPFEKRPYTLHVEFMLSYMPEARGQGRSNSGVYIDECYECQILDSFGLDGKNNECGGFYQQAEPLVNMCYPPLQWQTYDIDFVPAKFDAEGKKTANAKITVKHNGVVIHDNFEPKHETPGRKKETPEARGLYLQGHGNKAQFKNIWLKYH